LRLRPYSRLSVGSNELAYDEARRKFVAEASVVQISVLVATILTRILKP